MGLAIPVISDRRLRRVIDEDCWGFLVRISTAPRGHVSSSGYPERREFRLCPFQGPFGISSESHD